MNTLDKILPKEADLIRILFVGDVVGQPGLSMCARLIPEIKKRCQVDGVVINGENSSPDAKGITESSLKSLLSCGADVVTTGNHVWRFADFYPILDSCQQVVRPANFPKGSPGRGYAIFKVGELKVAVLNLMGRVFMREQVACPFQSALDLLPEIKAVADLVLLDFHAEATSEKAALALFLDGQISAIVGTHTHVQTADARVLPGGTAFISDLGCVAALNSCLGVEKSSVIGQMRSQLPAKFKVDKEPPFVFSGALVDIDPKTALARDIQPIRIIES